MEEPVFFKNRNGETLSGVFARATTTSARPVVVMAHGYGSKKNNSTNARATQLLVSKGISTFRFDFSGHGESDGTIAELTVSKGVEEVKAALDQVALTMGVDHSRIGLLGGSFGGNAMLLYAARFGGITAMALKSPISNYQEVRDLQLGAEALRLWKEQGWIQLPGGIRSNYEFYEDAGRINTYEEARHIRCPVLIVQGDRDEDIPMRHAEALLAALGPSARLSVIAGADHGYSNPQHFEQMISLLVDFVVQGFSL